MINTDLLETLLKQIKICKREINYRCGVYVRVMDRGRLVMDILKEMSETDPDVVRINHSRLDPHIKFSNGNMIQIVRADDSARGHRFNGVIIDNEVDKRCIDTVIMPHLMPLRDDNFTYINTDDPLTRLDYVDISYDDVIKARKYTKSYRAYHDNMQLATASISKNRGLRANMMVYDEKLFEKEYECMFEKNEYDVPIIIKELNGDKVMLFKAFGIPKDEVKYETEFVNKTKQTYLNVTGYGEIPDLDFGNQLNVHLLIDTTIYDGYEVHVNDGMVAVVFREIKNEAPVLKDYGTRKIC